MIKRVKGAYIARNKVSIFFLSSLTFSWAIWIPMALNRLNLITFDIPIIIGQSIGALGPMITLYLLDKLSNDSIGFKAIFDTIQIKGKKAHWLIPAAITLPILTILGNFIDSGIMNTQFMIFKPEILDDFGYWLILLVPGTLMLCLLSSPFFEEPCWRGFALGELQMKFGRHLGSLFLGSFWWLWHQPINIANGLEVSLYSYLFMVGQSFIYDSLFNLSGKNLLSAMLVHSSSIVSYNYLFYENSFSGLLVILITIIALRILECKIDSKQKFEKIVSKSISKIEKNNGVE